MSNKKRKRDSKKLLDLIIKAVIAVSALITAVAQLIESLK